MNERSSTTDMMVENLRQLLAAEPREADPEQLNGAAYYEAAELHYQWSRQVNAWRLLLGVRLVNDALEG